MRPALSRLVIVAGLLVVATPFHVEPRAQVAAPAAPAPVASATRRAISHDAYDGWKSIQGVKLSDQGTWLAYTLQPQDGDGELVARQLETGTEWRQPRGKDAQFTPDGRFVVFTVAPLKADVDKAKKAKKKAEDQPKAGLGVLDLSTGRAWTTDRVKSVEMPKDVVRAIAYLREPPEKKAGEKKDEEKKEGEDEKADGKKKEKKKEPGTDLVVHDLATGAETVIAEVADYEWSRDGAWLAYGVSSKTPAADGAFARRASDGVVTTLATGQGHYKGLTFDETGRQLAFVTDRDDYAADAPAFALYHWPVSTPSAVKLVDKATPGMPAGTAVSEHGKLEFSKDGRVLLLGTAPLPRPEPEHDPVKVDIWHWKDPLLQSVQKTRADEEKKRSYRAAVHLAGRRFVQLGSPEIPDVVVTPDGTAAAATSDVPYRPMVSWDGEYQDGYLLDLATGQSRRVVEKNRFDVTLSPGGKWLIYYNDSLRSWQTVSTTTGAVTDLTSRLPVRFEDETWDTPGQPQPYGLAGWLDQDGAVLVYDRYDIWELAPDGSRARNLTVDGRLTRHAYRYVKLDPEAKTIDPAAPLLLSMINDDTKASGFARTSLRDAAAPPTRLLEIDKSTGGVVKAKKAQTLVFTAQRFDEFPDLWRSDLSLASPARLTDANPQQREYRWGRSELISYTNADGRPLRAILTRPDDFDPAKKYPLLVYIYEELTNGLHRYVAPAPGTSINVTRYVSNGYVVLQPDIVYETGYPGRAPTSACCPPCRRSWTWGSWTRPAWGSRGTAGAATRSPT